MLKNFKQYISYNTSTDILKFLIRFGHSIGGARFGHSIGGARFGQAHLKSSTSTYPLIMISDRSLKLYDLHFKQIHAEK